MTSFDQPTGYSRLSTNLSQTAAAGYITLDERRRAALAEIDNATFSWFHLKVCMVAGVGFFADAYDLFAINIASMMLSFVPETGGDPDNFGKQDLGLKAATPIGTIFGQLVFGWLADRLGRKKMYGVELLIMIIATFAQALSGKTKAVSLLGSVIVWRFIMGVGIGGDYPLSAVIVSEFSPIHIRGRLMTTVVASQGWGNFTAALVSLALVLGYKKQLITLTSSVDNTGQVDYMWRLLIGFGCIPALLGLYFRLTVPETPRFTMDIERNLDQALADIDLSVGRAEVDYDSEVVRRVNIPKASWKDFSRCFSRWENFKVLFGVAYSWFAIDVALYGLGLNSVDFMTNLQLCHHATPNSIYQKLCDVSTGNIIVAGLGWIPGYWVTFAFIDSWGRKPIQLLGFGVLAVLYIVMGAAHITELQQADTAVIRMFLYCLANFFHNFGPNTTTFIIPGELFPTRYRSTCHGIAAASGKLGAIISLAIFYEIKIRNDASPDFMLFIFVPFMLTGIGATLLLPETRNRSLEDLSNEKQTGFVKGYAYRRTQQMRGALASS